MYDVTKKEEEIFSGFVNQLEKWSRDEKTPENGNQDTAYYLDLQQERLEKKGLHLQYDFKQREDFDIHGKRQKSRKYTCTMAWQGILKKTTFFRGKKKLYQKKDTELIYGIITSVNESEMTGEETYICPNCGAVSTIKELFGGCPYCQTRFAMSDLYPKVTNHFFLHDYGMNDSEARKRVLKFALAGVVLGCIVGLYTSNGTAVDQTGAGSTISNIIASSVAGGIFGLFVCPICLLIRLLVDSVKVTPILIKTAGTKKKITDLLSSYDAAFSYDHFVSRVLALLKMIVYSEDRTDMAAYDKAEKGPDYTDIVESIYRGAIALHKHKIEEGYCYLDLEVFMVDYCLRGNRIKPVGERFRMEICKNIEQPEDFGFSIKKVQCKNCGGSFDATRIKHCPYCSDEYELKEDDWVVLNIKRLG